VTWALLDLARHEITDAVVPQYSPMIPDSDAVASPQVYMAFDLLYRDGRDLSVRPLRDRRARLEDVVAGSESVFPVRRLARRMGWRRASR
jgi:ATP dependent DNA ligase domain